MFQTEAEVLEQGADDAGFLWLQRDSAVLDPRYTLADLRALDGRLDARLDLLREGGEAGLDLCLAWLESGGGGEAFAAALLALELGHKEELAEVIAFVEPSPVLARGLVSALGWAIPDVARPVLKDFLVPDAPPWKLRIGIAASAIRRSLPPFEALQAAMKAEDPALRARALRAVGELGWVELLADVGRALGDEDESCRYAAAYSLLLGGDSRAVSVFAALAEGGGPFAEKAAGMAVRGMSLPSARQWIQTLGAAPETRRAALAGAAVLGDAALVPWLLKQMQSPDAARLAGFAFSMLAGVDLENEKLDGPLPEAADKGPNDNPEDENVAPDPDEALPYPNAVAIERWWGKRAGEFPPGNRYVMGKPLTDEGIEEMLRKGTQPARASVAVERCRRKPRWGLFEVRARGERQAVELAM